MKVLVCGASGFIGRRLCARLRADGHEVVRGLRCASQPDEMEIDYSRDTSPAVWAPRLAGIDAVINTVGIIAERPGSTFANLHQRTPIALFHAAVQAGVRRVVQISALGADSGTTEYFRTKAAADAALMRLPIEWLVLRPSLVYGEEGASSTSFRILATLPVIALPSLPEQSRFQPVHVNDLADAVSIALQPQTSPRRCIECVGSTHHTLRAMIGTYRQAFALPTALWVTIPSAVMAMTARFTGQIPGATLNPATWRMLQQGNAADSSGFALLLGRAPQGLADFIGGPDAERLRARALASWQRPLLRYSLAAVWTLSALASLFAFPRVDSMALLARVGLSGVTAAACLYGASAIDLLLGIATLARPYRGTWIAQLALILGYTVVIVVAMPEWLWHPFGPILKNLPMLAILVVLASESRS
ncbi:MAG: SDR family oxidoreductase [Steroidobacteraceae bacterium]